MSRNDPRQNILEYNAHGEYRVSIAWSLAAGLGAGPVLAWRWGSAAALCIITRMSLGILQTGAAAGTGQFVGVQVFVARGYTASDTGGTAVTPAGNTAKLATTMAATLLTDLRISTGALLTPGTRGLDSIAFLSSLQIDAVTTPNPGTPPINAFDASGGANHPLVLAVNEGFVVNNVLGLAAGASLELTLDVEWSEVDAF